MLFPPQTNTVSQQGKIQLYPQPGKTMKTTYSSTLQGKKFSNQIKIYTTRHKNNFIELLLIYFSLNLYFKSLYQIVH